MIDYFVKTISNSWIYVHEVIQESKNKKISSNTAHSNNGVLIHAGEA